MGVRRRPFGCLVMARSAGSRAFASTKLWLVTCVVFRASSGKGMRRIAVLKNRSVVIFYALCGYGCISIEIVGFMIKIEGIVRIVSLMLT